jgi:outer membrane protein OmpA-like peptidoglycan-associated protein
MMLTWRMAGLSVGALVAACTSQTPRNDAAASTQANAVENEATVAPVDNAEAEAAAAPKSILRPEVTEEAPSAPVLAPLDETVPFGTSGTVLDDAGRAVLDQVLASPTLRAGGPVTLSGHSDSRGHDGDNLVVSRKRAEAVAAYLVGHGVARDRITVVALGEARPLVPNAHEDGSDDPEARAKNRRVGVAVALPAAEATVTPTPSPSPTPAAAVD